MNISFLSPDTQHIIFCQKELTLQFNILQSLTLEKTVSYILGMGHEITVSCALRWASFSISDVFILPPVPVQSQNKQTKEQRPETS